jgi:hypothetical protein
MSKPKPKPKPKKEPTPMSEVFFTMLFGPTKETKPKKR